ncbi:MAG: hypothetical protein H6R15_3126 [Proteobacteria bacterium]|nr:hypothetical protein [Pseudomonadota bacterium]
MKWWISFLLAVAGGTQATEQYLPPLTTGCNDLKDAGRSPGKEHEVFFDIQRPNPANRKASFSEEYPEVGEPISPEIRAESWETNLPEQPANLADPQKFDRKKLSIHGGYLYFYESDGKGGRRLCRREEWKNRKVMAFVSTSAKRGEYQTIPREKHYNFSGQHLDRPPQPSQTHNPVLAEIAKTYVPIAATRYRYDAAGHLVEIANFQELNWEEGSAKPTDWQFESQHRLSCRLYQGDGRLWRYADGFSDNAPDCTNIRAESAEYFEYRYDSTGKLTRSVQNISSPNKTNRWWQIWSFLVNGYQVEAETDDKVGIRHITGAVDEVAPRDNNAVNTSERYRDKVGTYFFPLHDAPVNLLDDFSKIYNFRRVLETGGGIARMMEAFPAGSSQLTARVWLNTYNNTLLREEQYKDGRLVRVINTDRANDPSHSLYYEEHLEKYAVKPKNLVQRVYEYDAKGNEKLVAISWTNVSKEVFYGDAPASGRIGPLIDLARDAKKAWNNRGKTAQPKPAQLEFYYGLPDGTVKWKDYAAFQKAFDIKENADWMYPNGQPKRF